ncbi:MAG: TlpA disulfide reductase family protein [Bacteroidota bacterium]
MKKFTFDKGLIFLLIMVVGFFIGRKIYFKPNVIQGDKAPIFSAQTLDSQNFELASLKGNYVLLDFWGSWCGPCRRENPALVELHEKYNKKRFEDAAKFEIVSVGIEKDRRRWLSAIKQDRLNWEYHISDLKEFDDEVAQSYGVRSIPSKFLINPEGVIISVNQSIKEIDEILAKKVEMDVSLTKQ